ncbi:MAG: TldD/PmbA family protein, partial [Dehalococcoidia bacterium]|nr:TldD/PmbA family protein [Dehalococcoidia bacterium]
MRNRLFDALRGHNADYVEVRLEEGEATQMSYRNNALEELSRTSSSGGNVRALVNGGWGFVSFNHPGNLREKVALAGKEARLVAGEAVKIPPREPVEDVVLAEVKKDAATVPLEHKKQVLDEYNDIILSTGKIQSARIDYR